MSHNPHRQSLTERDSWHHVAAGVWLLIDIGNLAILVALMWIFQPEHGILPGPTWLVDPLVGWVIGNVIGIAAYRQFMRFTPWALAAASLVGVALSPVIFVKNAALGGFVAGLIIGLVGGACYWRAHRGEPGPLL